MYWAKDHQRNGVADLGSRREAGDTEVSSEIPRVSILARVSGLLGNALKPVFTSILASGNAASYIVLGCSSPRTPVRVHTCRRSRDTVGVSNVFLCPLSQAPIFS